MIEEIKRRLGAGERVELECVDKRGFLYYQANHNLEEKKKVLESSLVIDPEKSKWGNYFFIEGSDSFVAGAELKYFRIKKQDKEREMNTKQQYDFKALVHFSEKAVRDGVVKEASLEFEELRVIKNDGWLLYGTSETVCESFLGGCFASLKREYEKQGVEFGDLKIKINGVSLEDLGKPDFDDLIDVAVQAYKDKVLSKVDMRDGEISLTGLGAINENRGSDVFQSAINDIQALYTETFKVESMEDLGKIKWICASAVLANGCDLPLSVLVGAFNESVTLRLLKGATITQKRGK